MKGLVIFRTGVPYIITTQHEKLILITFHSSFIARRNFITGIFIPLCYQKGIYAFLSLFILLDLFHKTIFHFPAHDLSKHKSPMCHTLVKLGGIRQSFEYISIYKIRHFKLQKKKKKRKKDGRIVGEKLFSTLTVRFLSRQYLTLMSLYFKVMIATVLLFVGISERLSAFHRFRHSMYTYSRICFFLFLKNV